MGDQDLSPFEIDLLKRLETYLLTDQYTSPGIVITKELLSRLEKEVVAKLKLEREVLNKLWDNYTNFRNVQTPVPEGDKGQLPIVPADCIQRPDLKGDLTSCVTTVWMPALVEESHCLFLDLCIWDPFRMDSPDNWALVNPGPYEKAQDPERARRNYEETREALSVYMEILGGEKVVAIDRRTGMQEILDPRSLGHDYVVADENGK